jgi:hypothetical protein
MLRKHTNDDASAVDVVGKHAEKGPISCPQIGCQNSSGTHPYSKGCVVYEIFGGYSGDYLTSTPCKCCDGKGFLYEDETAYSKYCNYHGVRDIRTGYPSPLPMSKDVYNSIALKEREIKEEKKSEGCYIATAVYGDYCAPEVLILRKVRDEVLIKSLSGRFFISTYYRVSPSLLRMFGANTLFLNMSKKIVDLLCKYLK